MFLVVVRPRGDPASVVESIRRALREIDPTLPLANVAPLDAVAGAALATRRLTLSLVAVFGLTALLLAVVGIYGVIAQSVGHRTQEFGVRLALGATQRRHPAFGADERRDLSVVGLCGGLLLAILSTRLFAAMLYRVSAFDPLQFSSVTLVLLTAALCAAYLPARRATHVSPSTALRATE